MKTAIFKFLIMSLALIASGCGSKSGGGGKLSPRSSKLNGSGNPSIGAGAKANGSLDSDNGNAGGSAATNANGCPTDFVGTYEGETKDGKRINLFILKNDTDDLQVSIGEIAKPLDVFVADGVKRTSADGSTILTAKCQDGKILTDGSDKGVRSTGEYALISTGLTIKQLTPTENLTTMRRISVPTDDVAVSDDTGAGDGN